MYFITRKTETREVTGIHYIANITDISKINTNGKQEAVEITETEFNDYSDQELTIYKYIYDNTEGFIENDTESTIRKEVEINVDEKL